MIPVQKLCLFLVLAFSLAAPARSATLLIEAEDFQFKGDWAVETARKETVERFLRTGVTTPKAPKPLDALTAIRIPQAGRYAVWARTRDYATQMPRSRIFQLLIDGAPLPRKGGQHGKEGWAWEELGSVELNAGEHMLALHHVNSFPRCDAIVLTSEGQSPAQWSKARLKQITVEPEQILMQQSHPAGEPTLAPNGARRTLARLENESLRLGFEAAAASDGKELIIKTAELKLADGQWHPLPQFGAGERLFMLYAADPGLKATEGLPRVPRWAVRGQAARVTVGGKAYAIKPGTTDNPFAAGEPRALLARSARQAAPDCVEIQYETADGTAATGRWTLAPGAHDAGFTLTLTPKASGYYSIGLCAFDQWTREQVKFVQLPPLFQFQRLPESPVLISSSITPHPLALVQVAPAGLGEIGFAITADAERIPFAWPTILNARYGFSLLNAAGRVQPCSFSPVLGYEGSKWEAGQPQTVGWRLYAAPGDWKTSLERISNEVMQLKDYRRPLGASLSEAALNMIDLIMDEAHGGWDPKMKGFYDIETKSMAKQAAPLTMLSVAALTRDERFFKERALPTLEFTLSRRRADFIDPATGEPKEAAQQLAVPNKFYEATYWQGAYELTGRLNPWLEEFILPGGQPAIRPVSGPASDFAEWLAAWRFRPENTDFLQKAKGEADAFLAREVYGPQTKPLSWQPFYNISFYPNWWNLLDLYEVTGETRYRDAAEEGAFHTLAGLWSAPRVPRGDVLIYPEGMKFPYHRIWSRNDKPYRLGWPPEAGEQRTPGVADWQRVPAKGLTPHEVPAWQVAEAGLGLEQPCTFVAGQTQEAGLSHIMMSTWAPHLLRAYQATGREIFRTYARNTIIGRFANYPGYYLLAFTDAVNNPQYPYQGPDLTDFYYHHIPVHLGFTLDYLVTEANVRSGGKIKFPYVTQKDYAWFNQREYGPMPGEVFGDKDAVLWLERGIEPCKKVEVDWLASRSPERYHVMLMNQLHEPVSVPVALSAEKTGVKPEAAGELRVNGEASARAVRADELKSIEIPALGMVTLSFPAQRREAFPQQTPLKHGHLIKKMSGAWGELHAFRIRSPFGADALYVVLTGQPPKGARAELELAGEKSTKVECVSYPYEFSIYPLPTGGEIRGEVKLQAAGSGNAESAALALGSE